MAVASPLSDKAASPLADHKRAKGKRRLSLPGPQSMAGWLFMAPALIILLVFLLIPIVLALYVSFTNWDGLSNPLSGALDWVGTKNYHRLLTSKGGLTHVNFMTSIRNNFYFVIFTVPLQTALALGLAVLVNNRALKGKGFFRTAFYFPSITSSIAITVVFIFLFQGSGAVNQVLKIFGAKGPNWLIDTRGVFWQVLRVFGVSSEPSWGKGHVLGLTWWDWVSGPSIGMCVIIILVVWTTSGTFMLMFLGALQNISEDIDEASEIDGTTAWQRFRLVTLPMLRPTLLLVLTLGLISTWQIFDQIVLTGDNNRSMITPAYLSYTQSFNNSNFGSGAAISFLLFALILTLSGLQRAFLREDIES